MAKGLTAIEPHLLLHTHPRAEMIHFTASLVLAAFVSLSRGDCPLSGCTSSRSFASETDYFNGTLLPKLLWSYEYPLRQTLRAGCATNGGRVVCPVAAETG